MKVAAILLLSTILVQATPVEKREASAASFDPFAHMVQKSISENDFNALCDLTKNLQTILTESNNEGDQITIGKSLETLKEATRHLENFHCLVPNWVETSHKNWMSPYFISILVLLSFIVLLVVAGLIKIFCVQE